VLPLAGEKVSPLCPHFLEPRGNQGVLEGSKGLEKTKVRGQVVDKISTSLGSHGGVFVEKAQIPRILITF